MSNYFGIRWRKFVEAEAPEKEKFPQEWKKKDALQRLCMMRALRPDRMLYAVQEFVEEKLGPKYISNKSVHNAKRWVHILLDSVTVSLFFVTNLT